MNDNCSQCGYKRYVDPPLTGKVGRVICNACLSTEHYVWCQLHDKICVWSSQCLPSNHSAFEHVYTYTPTNTVSEKELLIKLIEKLDTFGKRFDHIDRKLQDLENMIKYSPGSEIYNSAKSEFEKLKK